MPSSNPAALPSPPPAEPGGAARPLRILQLADLHFAAPAAPLLVAALERLMAAERYDVVAFCGDFAQRARIGEFLAGAALVRHAQRYSATIAVPGNHDIAWWQSPLHLRGAEPISRKYRRWFAADLEPVLRVPGATFVGLNSCHGIAPYTLTKRPRDLSVVGALTSEQLQRCRAELDAIPVGQLRVVVLHHNVVRGELSQRFGIPKPRRALATFAAARCDLVLCAHDHQERVEEVRLDSGAHPMVVSVCGTVSTRSRGGRPCSVTEISVTSTRLTLQIRMAKADLSAFEQAECFTFARHA